MYKKKVFKRDVPYNPLEPSWVIKNEDGKLENYGSIEGSKIKPTYHRTNKKEMDNSLKCSDIYGNVPGSSVLGAFHNRERRGYKKTGNNDDI